MCTLKRRRFECDLGHLNSLVADVFKHNGLKAPELLVLRDNYKEKTKDDGMLEQNSQNFSVLSRVGAGSLLLSVTRSSCKMPHNCTESKKFQRTGIHGVRMLQF